MNRKQEKFFEERFAEVTAKKRDEAWNEPSMPPAVKKAQEIVTRWKQQCTKESQRKRKRLEEVSRPARKAIYFGTAEEAEAALSDLEKSKL